MQRNKTLYTVIPVVVIFLLAAMAPPLSAGDKKDDFYGSFYVGYRFVGIDGVETKYKEDLNLDQGPRLFNFNLHYLPDSGIKKLFDRLDLKIYSFGGDPYESLGLSVVKYGKYSFDYTRGKLTYYYNDILQGGDFHTMDFVRIHDSGKLKIWFAKYLKFYMSFDRYTKNGDSTISYDINRTEFEFDLPVKETSYEFTIGADIDLKWFNLVLEEKIREYENVNSLFLPGYADGGPDARYPSALLYLTLNQPYDLSSYTHTARFNARPLRNLLIKGSAQASNQDTNVHYSENAAGFDYLGYDFSYDMAGSGKFQRDIYILDLDLSYMLANRLAIVGAVRYNEFNQEGTFEVDGNRKSADWDFHTLGFEAGVQYQVNPMVGFSLGFRYEERTINEGVEELVEESTERLGFFGNIKLNLSQHAKLTADYQYGSYEDVFTLTSPTDFHRFRFMAKLKFKPFYLNASYMFNITETTVDTTFWESDKHQLTVRAGYWKKKFKANIGYSYIDIEQKGDRMVAYPPYWTGPAGEFPWDILFEGRTNMLDASFNVGISNYWSLGAYVNYYENRGSWELTRTFAKAYLEYLCKTGLIVRLAYGFLDYQEEALGLNDYSANIFEISFGYKW